MNNVSIIGLFIFLMFVGTIIDNPIMKLRQKYGVLVILSPILHQNWDHFKGNVVWFSHASLMFIGLGSIFSFEHVLLLIITIDIILATYNQIVRHVYVHGASNVVTALYFVVFTSIIINTINNMGNISLDFLLEMITFITVGYIALIEVYRSYKYVEIHKYGVINGIISSIILVGYLYHLY